MAILFYGLGWIARRLQLAELLKVIKKHMLVSAIAAIALSVVLLPLVFFNGEVNMRTITYGNYFLYVFNAIAYSFVLIIISMIIEEAVAGKKLGNFLEWIGRNTLVVLLLNSTCVRVYEVVFGSFFNKLDDVAVYGMNAVVAILITVFCAIASEFINRFCPYLIGKKRIK
jgi:fucose 4-O-acetylase-like acetyltransferase